MELEGQTLKPWTQKHQDPYWCLLGNIQLLLFLEKGCLFLTVFVFTIFFFLLAWPAQTVPKFYWSPRTILLFTEEGLSLVQSDHFSTPGSICFGQGDRVVCGRDNALMGKGVSPCEVGDTPKRTSGKHRGRHMCRFELMRARAWALTSSNKICSLVIF